jgi:hypothetical protein
MMHYRLPEMLTAVGGEGIKDLLREVVRDALCAMKHDKNIETNKLRILREEVGIGIDDADSGRFSDRTVNYILQSILLTNRT